MKIINYTDMHCDTVTVCADRVADLRENGFQLDLKRLSSSGCAAQCFAIFTKGETAPKDFERYLAFYKRMLLEHGDLILSVENYGDLVAAQKSNKVGAILTVENLGFIGTDLDRLNALEKNGVCMASLVWNYENALARPNLIFENDFPAFEKRVNTGLTDLGREAAERLDKLKIIIDISHLSDGGADELLNGRKIPLVASHSNAQGAYNVSRNLTDGQIKKIADCGGVVGVNFCFDFLGGSGGFESVYNHISHIINVGGEDVAALGSDFDGIPLSPQLEDCTRMQALFEYLSGRGLPFNTIEKLAYKNFFRVFKEIRG
ncbi:MAG: dipeptidase [Clostridia bacterium]|nr:dipeptidase [Clostridia bacterium]